MEVQNSWQTFFPLAKRARIRLKFRKTLSRLYILYRILCTSAEVSSIVILSSLHQVIRSQDLWHSRTPTTISGECFWNFFSTYFGCVFVCACRRFASANTPNALDAFYFRFKRIQTTNWLFFCWPGCTIICHFMNIALDFLPLNFTRWNRPQTCMHTQTNIRT